MLGTDKTGSLQFTVTESLEEAEQAARELQVLYCDNARPKYPQAISAQWKQVQGGCASQERYQGQGDMQALENLKLLVSMGLEVTSRAASSPFALAELDSERPLSLILRDHHADCLRVLQVRYCSSNPFIGKLTFKFLSVRGTKHGELALLLPSHKLLPQPIACPLSGAYRAFRERQRPVSLGHAADSTYVKVRLEGDRTVPYYICGEGTSEDSAEFSKKPLIFVVIHSDAVASIKVRDKKDGAHFYGQARSSTWSSPEWI